MILNDYQEDTHNIVCDVSAKISYRIHCYTVPKEELIEYDGWNYLITSLERGNKVSLKTTEIFVSGRLAFQSALCDVINKLNKLE